MAEALNQVFIGVGKPENSKRGFIENVKRAFIPKYAKERWYEKHQKEIDEYKSIEAQLTPQEREAAVAKLENKATKGAIVRVATSWTTLAASLSAVYVGGRLVLDPKFAEKAGKWNPKIPFTDTEIPIGKGMEKFGKSGKQRLDWITDKAKGLRHGADGNESQKKTKKSSAPDLPSSEPNKPMSKTDLLLQKTRANITARGAAEREFAATIDALLQSPKAQALPPDIDLGFLPEEKLALGHEWGRLEQFWRHGHKLETPKYDQLKKLFHLQDLNTINNAIPVPTDTSPLIRIKFKEIGDPFFSDEAKHRLRDYFDTCRNKGKWLPMFEDGLNILFTGNREFNHIHVDELVQEGLFKKHDFMGGGSVITVTKKGVEFILKHLQNLKPIVENTS